MRIQIFHLSNEKVSTNTDVAHDRVNCLDTRFLLSRKLLALVQRPVSNNRTAILAAVERLCPLHITSGINIKFHTMIAISLPSHQQSLLASSTVAVRAAV